MSFITEYLNKGDYLTNWLVSTPKQKELITEKVAFSTNQEFSEEHVDVIYPLRREFLEWRKHVDCEYRVQNPQNIYFPFENKRVEFSAMIKTPFYISANAESYLISSESGLYSFELVTCGGVTIWIDGQKFTDFLPFTRNTPSKTILNIPLKKGKNLIQVFFEDIAERDVYFYFQLKLLKIPIGNPGLQQVIETDVSQREYDKIIKFIDSISFTRDEYTNGDVVINHNSSMEKSELYVRINYSPFYDPTIEKKHLLEFSDKNSFNSNSVTLGTNQTKLFSVGEVISGTKNIELGIKLSNGMMAYKRFCISIYNSKQFDIAFPKDIVSRKHTILNILAESDTEDISKALARLNIYGKCDEYTKALILDSLTIIVDRGDCADFRTAPLLIILMKYNHLLDDDILKKIEECFLNFRYWTDEPGNDSMWYFSENHALLFHLTQYLAGGYFKDKIFTASQRTGLQQQTIGRERLESWFRSFEKDGFSEWNSTTYIPVDLIGFFTLDLLDDYFKNHVRKALNFSFEIISSHLLKDTFSSTYGRVYEKELKGFKCGEMASIIKMAWNKGFFNHHNRVLVPFALSEYTPLPLQPNPSDNQGLEYMYRQGGKAKLYTFKTNDYIMSSVEHFSPFKRGHQQHTLNLLVGKEQVPVWINHPGEFVTSGENRPSYWAGNGVLPDIYQEKNIALIEYHLGQSEIKFTHVYLPVGSYHRVHTLDIGFALEFREIFIMFFTPNSYELVNDGATASREIKIFGDCQKLVVKVHTKNDINRCEIEEYLKNYCKNIDFNQMKVTDPQWGVITTMNREYHYFNPIEGSNLIEIPSIENLVEQGLLM